ncbi:MAG: heme-binding protein [Erysipelotrichaceae bacterium]|nr:heme-binding protein [Erysipelotrichaceae bacterium]
MDAKEALALILQQEQEIILDHFDQDDLKLLAFDLMKHADESTIPLTIRITKGQQILFAYVANQNSLDKDNWVRRKINTVMNFGHSSLWLYYKTNGDSQQLMQKYGLSMEDYTVSGGAVPLFVKGVGLIGAVAVSGYSGIWDDHQLIIDALKNLKEKQHAE